MTGHTRFDLIIVGGGLVGSALALALGREHPGLRLALVEAGSGPECYQGLSFDPRVVALTPASQRFLARIGVWQRLDRLCPFEDMHVWDGEGTGQIHFSAADVHQSCLGHIVENSVVLRAMEAELALLPGLARYQPSRVTGLVRDTNQTTGVALENDLTLAAPLVVAADGARSMIRELAGFVTREWDYGQAAIVTSVRCEKPHAFTAWQRFMRTGPLAFLPLLEADDDHWCSIVWSADTPFAESLMALDAEAFAERLETAFEYRLGRIEAPAERFCLPLRQRHARDYIQPGIALVGDAAHNIHPLAGQGVNLGLQDAEVLTGEILRAMARQLPLGDYSLLRRYQRQRLGSNLTMMAAMEGFKHLFGNASPALTWLRNRGMQGVNDAAALKQMILKQVMG